MKTLKKNLKALALFLFIVMVFASCRDGKEGEAIDDDSDSNTEQLKNASATDDDSGEIKSKPPQESNTSIVEEDNDATSPDAMEGNTAAITLDCDYFSKHPNTVLKDNPEAPVDYIIPCVARIDGKLTIEPGVVIAFKQGAGIDFYAKSSFKMNGTAEKPIVLTGKEKIKGFWWGVRTESNSITNAMSYVTIDYAGGGLKAALKINNEKSSVKLEHCTFSNSKEYGMITKRGVDKDVHNIVMNNCNFTKNKIPVHTDASRLRLFNGSNKFSGNEKDYIHLEGGTMRGDATWAKLDVPYFLQNNFTIKEGVFTVAPGAEIIMSSQKWIHVSEEASLLMIGTPEAPIKFRGERDIAGFWQQINVKSSSPLNEMGHVIIENAGRTTKKPNGAVFFERSRFLNIHDVIFRNCFEYGITVQDAAQSNLKYANLSLDNTPKLFSDWSGKEIVAPEKP
ncbi:hypothetical protein [Aequorivita capsosiphonis]|uniref:hypothetical protein n=1 Tax=Aequorivita capsosiphonis TaxID=487317 RepID=UPI0004212A8C|nr:hypothetical protein [Aequorivita capsosiphonis]